MVRARLLVATSLASLLTPITASADPIDTLRSLPTRAVRGQLERINDVLSLAASVSTGELLTRIQESPEAQLIGLFLLSNPPNAVVVDAYAAAGGGAMNDGDITGGGELTAILRARVVGEYCDIAHASLSARSTFAEGEVGATEARAGAGFCFWRGLYGKPTADSPGSGSLFPVQMKGSVAINASPRFGGLRNEPRRRYSEAEYSFAIDAIRYSLHTPLRGFTVGYGGFQQRWEWAKDFTGDHAYEVAGGFGFVRLWRTRDAVALSDRSIDIIDFRLHGLKAAEPVALVDAYLIRFHGIGFLDDHLLVDADLGASGSNATIGTSNCLDMVGCTEEMINTGDNVAKVSTWVARGALASGTQLAGGGVSFVRRLDSNILGQLAVESRATAWAQRVGRDMTARGEVYGGTATHYLDVDARGRERFAGASLDLQYKLGHGLAAGLELDAIRCWDRDANLEGRVAGSGARAFVTLSYSVELHRRDIEVAVQPEPPVFLQPAPPPPADAPPPYTAPPDTAPVPDASDAPPPAP